MRAFVAQGAKVAIGDISQCDEAGRKLVSSLGEDKAMYLRLDVRERKDWENAVNATKEKFGALNVLVNNAGELPRAWRRAGRS